MNRKIISLFIASMCLLAVPVHAEEKTVNVIVPVSCTAKNSTEQYTISMKGDSQYQAAPDILTLKDGEEGKFSLTIDYPGTYDYTVTESAGTDKYTTYDGTVYQVKVYATEDDKGYLSAEAVVYAEGSSDKAASCSFVNTYTPPVTPKVTTTPKSSTATATKKTGDSSSVTSKVSPKTGLKNHALLYGGIGIALAGMALLVIRRRRAE